MPPRRTHIMAEVITIPTSEKYTDGDGATHTRKGTRQVTKQERLFELVRLGCTQKEAAVYAGISESSFYNWVERGSKSKRGRYHEFYEGLQTALAQALVGLELDARQMAKNEPKVLCFILERRYPALYGKSPDIVINNGGRVERVDVIVQLPGLSKEQLAALAGADLDGPELALPTAPLHDRPEPETQDPD